ncbi:MAG TPA: hypothetical protein DCS93_37500 [Microscillaceae bacterium]|nr:hypothetical protein [Microscillaceae bacterium]
MDNLYIESNIGVFSNPTITLNAETGECRIEGESYLENAYGFYQPVFDWIATYTQQVQQTLTWHFRLSYFNSSSEKVIADLLMLLKEYQSQGGIAKINWYYPTEIEDILSQGEYLIRLTELPIQLIPYKLA